MNITPFCHSKPTKPELLISFSRISILGFDAQNGFAGGNLVADGGVDGGHSTGAGCLDIVLGLHGFHRCDDLPLCYSVADLDVDLNQLDVAFEW